MLQLDLRLLPLFVGKLFTTTILFDYFLLSPKSLVRFEFFLSKISGHPSFRSFYGFVCNWFSGFLVMKPYFKSESLPSISSFRNHTKQVFVMLSPLLLSLTSPHSSPFSQSQSLNGHAQNHTVAGHRLGPSDDRRSASLIRPLALRGLCRSLIPYPPPHLPPSLSLTSLHLCKPR